MNADWSGPISGRLARCGTRLIWRAEERRRLASSPALTPWERDAFLRVGIGRETV